MEELKTNGYGFKKSIITYLIRPPEDSSVVPEDISNDEFSLISPLSKIINGIFDMDRIEHLMSDTYYTGHVAFSYDYSKILDGYVLFKDKDDKYQLGLLEGNIPDFVSFLLTRQEIKRTIWSDANVRGYEIMLRHAVMNALDKEKMTFKNSTLGMICFFGES